MKHKAYRQKVKASFREELRNRNNSQNKEGRDIFVRTDSKVNDYLFSCCIFPNDTAVNRIIIRILKNKIGEILFGFKNNEKINYDVLRIEQTEFGCIPTEFIPYKNDIFDLYSLLNPDINDPYESVFNKLQEHFERKNSCINGEYLKYLYSEIKKIIVSRGKVDESIVYFLDKRMM